MINVKDFTSQWYKEKDDLSIPLDTYIYSYCNPHSIPDTTIYTPEVSSCSNGCYEDNNPCESNILFQQNAVTNSTYQENNLTSITTSTTTIGTKEIDNGDVPELFDSLQAIENNISASINFSTSSQFLVPPYHVGQQRDEFDMSSLLPASPPTDFFQGLPKYSVDHIVPIMAPSICSVNQDNIPFSAPSFPPLNPSVSTCSFLGPAMGTYVSQNINSSLSIENPGNFATNLLPTDDFLPRKLEYPGQTSMMFCPDPMPRILKVPALQVLGTENQPLAGGSSGSTSLSTEISGLDDPTLLKVRKLTVQQKKEKIHRYLKKRNKRNFSKKIKYACRKTLADNRPRVRGRFAKNDDHGESRRSFSGNKEEDEEMRYIFPTDHSQSPGLDYH